MVFVADKPAEHMHILTVQVWSSIRATETSRVESNSRLEKLQRTTINNTQNQGIPIWHFPVPIMPRVQYIST